MPTLADFDRQVAKAMEDVGAPISTAAWFRGHSSSSFKLVPSLLRQNNGRGVKYEAEIYAEFIRMARLKNVNNRPFPVNDQWATLSLMRHYGVPTRLLDWSTLISVATYFALCEPTRSPVIWVLNPFKLNKSTFGRNVIIDDVDPFIVGGRVVDYYEEISRRPRRPWPVRHPVAMAPPFMNDRIAAQYGAFTVHGADVRPLEELCTESVLQPVKIHSSLRKPLWRRLMKGGMNGGSLYPDLFGVAAGLREKFALRR